MSAIKRNNVIVKGKGDSVIMFAHGFRCDQNMWRYVAPAFEDQYKVILFDHVGAGKSDLAALQKRETGPAKTGWGSGFIFHQKLRALIMLN